MAAVSEDPITLWLKLGAVDKLEQVVLDGYGDQLYGKTSRIPQVNKFLRQVPLFQVSQIIFCQLIFLMKTMVSIKKFLQVPSMRNFELHRVY